MGFFGNQLSNVVEWQEYRDDIIFWKWCNDEIKKGSRLIIRPGQDAIFMYNGKTEGVFRDEGSFDIESDIIYRRRSSIFRVVFRFVLLARLAAKCPIIRR